MKKKLTAITALVIALLTFAASVGVLIAWFVNYEYLGSTQYQILQIDSAINMYSNSGVGSSIEIAATDTIEESKFMLSEQSSATTFTKVYMEDMVPSRTFTYKFEIINYATAATIKSEFDNYANAESYIGTDYFDTTNGTDNQTRLGYLEARIFYSTDNKTFTKLNENKDNNGWVNFAEGGTALASEADNIEIGAYGSGNNKVYLVLQIRMKCAAPKTVDAVSLENADIYLPYFLTTLTTVDSTTTNS